MKKPFCPVCGTDENVKQIQYGYPLEATNEDEDTILGGCIVFEGQPEWVCTVCDWDDSVFEDFEGLEES